MEGRFVKVLLIEDSAAYAELLIHELRLGGYEPDAQRVETRAQTAAALDQANWDIIFTDNSLPGFRGPDVLDMLHERDLDTPVILISGTLDEAQALEVLQAGAKVFISKDRLVRLLPGVARELGAAAARAALEKAQLIIETMGDGVWILDDNERTTFVNRRLCELLGYEPDELVGRPALDLVHADERGVLREGRRRFGCRLLHSDGRELYVLVRSSPLQHYDGDTTGTLLVVADVTEGKRAQEELVATEQRYRSLLERIPLVTYVDLIDEASTNVFSSPQIEMLFGYSIDEWQSDPGFFRKVLHPEDRERVLGDHARTHATGEPLRTEYRVVKRDGQVVWVLDEGVVIPDDSGEPGYLQGFLLDVTEHRRLEEELRKSQAMEAVGRFAGALTHDFNNMLLAIQGSAEVAAAEARSVAAGADELRGSIDTILEATGRASMLTRSLLAFGRNYQLEPTVVDLNELVAEVEQLLRGIVASDRIEVRVRKAGMPCHVCADVSRLEQAILNLAINARDAMPDGGRLTVAIERVSLDRSEALPSIELDARAYYRVSVMDTGVGMDEATRARAFEPFFTTKADKGTGLGLSTVYGFVTQSDGAVVVESEPGQGTRIDIYLPAVS